MKLRYRLAWMTGKTLSAWLWHFRSLWSDRIPSRGPVLIASNHVSNWDPIFVGLGCPREIHYLAKDELFRSALLSWFIRNFNAIPVRRGRMDRRALRAATHVLDTDGALLMFPEGTRSKTGEIGKTRPGVGYLSGTTGAPVVPAYITGSHTLGSCFRARGTLIVAYGEPMRAPDPNDGETHEEFTASVMERIRRLKQEVESS